MNIKKILVIDDLERNILDAQEDLGDISTARSYIEFESLMSKEKYDCILSDLYFPVGEKEKNEKLKKETLEILGNYIKEQQKYNPVGWALEQVCNALELKSIEEYFEKFNHLKDPVLKGYKERIILGYNDYEKVKEYKNLFNQIENEIHELPSGIFVYKECENKNIPCSIVTSAYHHGTEFQPFTNQVGNYVDTLIEEKKEWKKALRSLMGSE